MKNVKSLIPSALAAPILVAVLTVAMAPTVGAADEPIIDKSSVQVTTQRHSSYYGKGDRDESTWSWTPKISFRVSGPISAGSQLQVEYTLPGNKPWLNLNCTTREIKAGRWWQVDNPPCGNNLPDEKGSVVTGIVDFKIILKNALEGTSLPLFTGKLVIGRVHIGLDLPKFKNNFEYYAEQDWNLPIGYVYAPGPKQSASGGSENVDYAPLCVSLWFRGNPPEGQLNGYLLYNGKVIANTEKTDSGTINDEVLNATYDESPFIWSRKKFTFVNVLVFDHTQYHPAAFHLGKNPGDYEVKVLRNGNLVRRAKFTVGINGKVVDTGLSKNNNVGTGRIIIPVQVLGNEDGQWDKLAWQTGTFYGNPLTGFTAP